MRPIFFVWLVLLPVLAMSQDFEPPTLQAGRVQGAIKLDGNLNEPGWQQAPVLTGLHTTVPVEGGTPAGKTEIRVLAEPKNIYLGIICYDPEPD